MSPIDSPHHPTPPLGRLDALADGPSGTPTPAVPSRADSAWIGLADGLQRLADLWPQVAAAVPARLGRFEVVRPLGRGGFGLVLLAHDPQLNRDVALKVPRPDAPLSDSLWRRFAREGRAAAALDHPYIVPVYETGEAGSVPYIACAYCPGPSLAEWLRTHMPDFAAAARLVARLAGAAGHAHGRGVLHRDLKPGNVLLFPDRPDPCELDDFTPRLSDFGLARLIDDDAGETTHSHALIGTPAYMAPEQAAGRAHDIDARSDVYGLGAILYELLTGRPPFAGLGGADTMLRVVVDDPEPPRRARPRVPADLEAVCLKCLEKEPARRYATAESLADDLHRFLDGQPTLARPLTAAGALRRWARREPRQAGLAALAAAAVLAAIGVGGWAGVRVAVARAEARDAGRLADTQEFFALIERVRQRRSEPTPGWVDASLADLRRAVALPPAAERLPDLRTAAAAALAGIELRFVRTLSDDFPVYEVAYSPDSRTLALGGWADDGGVGRVRLVDPGDGTVRRELTFAAAPPRGRRHCGVRELAFSPDGRWLVAASRFGGLHRWDLSRPESGAVSWDGGGDQASELAFGTVRPLLFAEANHRLRVWDAADGWKELPAWAASAARVEQATGRVAYVVDAQLHLLDGKTLAPARPPRPAPGLAVPAAFGPGGLLAFVQSQYVWLGDADRGRDWRPLTDGGERADAEPLASVAFAPCGSLLAASSEWSRHVKLWDVAGGRLLAERVAGAGSMRSAFCPKGLALALAVNRAVSLYEPTGRDVLTTHAAQGLTVRAAALGPDGQALLTVGTAGVTPNTASATRWPGGGRLELPDPDHRNSAALAPDGRGAAVAAGNGVAYWPDPAAARTDDRPFEDVKQIRFGPDGRLWVVARHEVASFAMPGWRPAAKWVNPPTEDDAERICYSAAVGPTRLVAGRRDGSLLLLDAATGERRATWRVASTPVAAVALDEPSGLAAAGDEAGRVRLFRVPSGATVADLARAHKDGVDAVALAPGGKLLATGGRDRVIHLWKPDGTPVLTLRMTSPVTMLEFTSDGSDLVALAAGERGVRRWHLARLAAKLRDLGIDPGW